MSVFDYMSNGTSLGVMCSLPRGICGNFGVVISHINRVPFDETDAFYDDAARLQYEFVLSRSFSSWMNPNELWSFSSTNSSWTRRGSRIRTMDGSLNNPLIRDEIDRLMVRRYTRYLLYANMLTLPSVIIELIIEFL